MSMSTVAGRRRVGLPRLSTFWLFWLFCRTLIAWQLFIDWITFHVYVASNHVDPTIPIQRRQTRQKRTRNALGSHSLATVTTRTAPSGIRHFV